MLRRPLRALAPLVLALTFVSIGYAQPVTLAPALTLAPPQRLSDFRFGGAASGERILGAVPRGDGFVVFEIGGDDLRAVPVDASGHAETASARVLFPNATARGLGFTLTTIGSRAVVFWSAGGTMRFSPAASDALQLPGGVAIAAAAQILGARCNATHCLVRYYDPSLVSRAAIVGLDGAVIATDLRVTGNLAGVDDGGFLLFSSTGAGTAAAPFETHLVRIDNAGRQTFDTPGDPAAGWIVALAPPGSSTYAVVWSRSNYPDSTATIYAAPLTLDGQLGERRTIVESGAGSPSAIVWNGGEFLLAFSVAHFRGVIPEATQPADLLVQRLSPSLAPLGGPVQASTSPEGNYLAGLAANGGAYYVGWNEFANGGFVPVARGAVLDERANVLAREAFAVARLPQTPLALAVEGDRAVAVWTERDVDRGIARLLYARATRDGLPIDRQPFLFAEAHDFALAAASAIESDVLVAWTQDFNADEESSRVRAAIVHTADGSYDEVTLPETFHGSFDAVVPIAVASNGESWLLAVGQRYVRISRAGVVLNPEPVVFAPMTPNYLSAASDGAGFLLVWNRDPRYPACVDCGGLRFASIDAAGMIVKPEQRLATNPLDRKPSVGFNGHDYLVVSADHENVWFRRFDRSGTLLSTDTIEQRHQDGAFTTVVRLGTGWFAAWWEWDGARQGVRIAADGTIAGEPVALPPIAALASTGSSTALALTTQRIDVPPYGTGIAATLQELTSESVPRRRAAGYR